MRVNDVSVNNLNILTAYLTAPVYKLISEKKTTYEGAIRALKTILFQTQK